MIPSATLAYDSTTKPPGFEVRSSIEINAPPAEVWKHVVEFSELAEPQEWYFRAGIAYPKRARIEGAGAGAIRYCDFSTGSFVEPIEVWSEPHLLRFRVTDNPAPMREWSPYSQVQAPHLHGYFISRQGQFRLTDLGNGRTLLEGTTWYQHGLWPAGYWRWWSDAIMDCLRPLGAICIIDASHTCMTIRGIKKPGSTLVTSAIRGTFLKNQATRNEVLNLIYRSTGL